ncbi:MAG: BNR repeat-containing glycosyl hydrolase [uncultured bacterium (gcode 4)]|uniref:BNR repeat-containing glycosyl hydrolase n=1 Tax=uncultured bacterium (gcode 4) TaxID=1234023 RepID=K1XY01_9BACT|nr:MAG: BNR repeat-containing glycosyl hydrolase [uncultured bacterium (gcode 4)]
MFKKIVSFLVIVSIIISSLGIDQAFAAASLRVVQLLINGASSTIYKNPGDSFKVQIDGQNNGTDILTNIYGYIYFSDNANFSFIGNNGAYIGWTKQRDIATTEYNSTSWLSSLVTSSLAVNGEPKIFLNSGTNNFSISSTISSYENYIYWKFTSDQANSGISQLVIYANVKPHITDYSFSKSSVVGNGADSVDLTMKVKDYNGCSNVDAGVVTANLSALWLSSSESLTYDSCEADGKTAVFKKIGITTLSAVWDKTFAYTDFTAKDENNNLTSPTDPNTTFDDEDKKTDSVLTVANPVAPVVTISGTNPSIVSSQNSTVSFSGDKSGTYKVVINGNGSCSAWIIVTDWSAYATGATVDSIVSAWSLSDGANTVYTCIKNDVGDIGSANTVITKDTAAPTISSITVTPASVITNNSSLSFQCSENGQYKAVMNAFDTWYLTATANTPYTVTLPNANINVWANTITTYCKDAAWNESTATTSVSKVAPTPAMTSSGLTVTDNDIWWDWVDGRDIKITWDSAVATSYVGFESYRLYILPENTAFTGTYIGLVSNSGATTWTGSSNILNDSLWNSLASWNYVAYIAIMGTSGNLWGAASATGTLVADIVPHPSVLSASFTSTGNLRVKFDTALKTDTGSHFATGFVYQVGAVTYTGTSISSISDDIINVLIPDVGSTSATGILTVATGAAWWVPVDGSYNYGSWWIAVWDAINPGITGYSTGTVSYYTDFYSGSLVFNYTVSENLLWAGNTQILFTRVWWNADTSKVYYISDSAKLTSWAHSETVNLSSLGLVSGTYYEASLIAKDLSWNTTTSAPITIKFDNVGPSIVSLNPFWPNKVFGLLAPTFTWFSTTDDSGNWSGVKWYKLRVYTGSTTYTSWKTCTGAYVEYTHADLGSLSKSITLSNLYNYAWGAYAYDNMENVGTISSCDNFYINTDVPSFSASSITDTVLNSTSYTKGGNTLIIRSTITNTDSWHIWLNASSINDSSYANISCATPVSGVTCNFASNIATFTFATGALGSLSSATKQVQFTATNIAGINTGTTLTSITLDNTAPTPPSLIVPVTSSVYGWSGMSITFAGASDNIGIRYLKFEYLSGAVWNPIGTGANISPYIWNLTSIDSGDYQIKITAYDMADNTWSVTSGIFSVDKIAPTVPANALTYPSVAWIKLKWWTSVNITWNAGSITDAGWLAVNPITLYYSTDSGTNYTQIATSEANDGTYAWLVPVLNIATMKIKITATDNIQNISFDTSDNTFEIDSTLPVINISYAGIGWSTPQTNSYINNSWFDVSATVSDNNLSGGNIYYSLFNQTANVYFSGTTYTGSTEVWNLLGTSTGSSYNLSSTITSSITNGDYYKLKFRADDITGNTFSTSQVTFIGDTINPTLAVTTASGTYFSGSLLLAGTSSDTGSTISSVNLEIKKWAEWWNGSNWVGNEQLLLATTTNSYANWNYNFTAPGADLDGQAYGVIVHAYDKSYKTNNTASQSINIVLDETWPVIENDVFTFVPAWFYAGWSSFDITWNPAKITASGASFSHLRLEYNNNGVITVITGSTLNDGSHSFNLPAIDDSITILISAMDGIWNASNSIASSQILIDSTPPQIQSIETLDMSADGQIDALKLTMSESILDSSIVLGNFSISSIWVPTSWETGNSANDSVFLLRFSNTGTTATIPTLTYTKGALVDLAGKFLENVSPSPSTDTAEPRISSADIFANASGIFNRIEVTFSENISSTTDVTAFTLNNGLTLSSVSTSGTKATLNLNLWSVHTDSTGYTLDFTSNSNWKDGSNNQAGSLGTAINLSDKAVPVLLSSLIKDSNGDYIADTVELTFSESLTGTLSGFSISTGSIGSTSLIGGNKIVLWVSGISGTVPVVTVSYAWDLSDGSANSVASLTNSALAEKIPPRFLSSHTLDSNGNGKIDSVLLNFSEWLNSNLSDINIWASSYGLNMVWTYAMSGSTQVIVKLNEKPIFDTDSTPIVTINSNSALTDVWWNIILASQSNTASDSVWPVILSARFDEWTQDLHIVFSETVSWSLNNASFTLSWATSTISSTTFVSWNNTAVINLTGTGITYGTSEISFASSAAGDSLGNKQTLASFAKISASVILNEVMSVWDVVYIELKNISSANVDISGWVIENALWNGVHYTIPASPQVSANGYYLISTNDLSYSWVISNQTAALSITTDLILKNGTISVDSALYQAWVNNTSLERTAGCWNGLSSACWYGAVASNGFVNGSYKGTPKTANVLDATNPTLNSNMANDTILPLWYYDLSYDYNDTIWINTGSISFALEKWNGSNFVANSSFSTGSVSVSQANYTLSWLTLWKYKATFSISDTSWNAISTQEIFYVDNFSFSISTGSIDLWTLEPDVQKLANTDITVTVNTIGAWFSLNHTYTGSSMADWTGAGWYGACVGNSCTILENFKSKNIATQTGELQSSGALKAYTYDIKYGALINSMQSAWIYTISNSYNLEISY